MNKRIKIKKGSFIEHFGENCKSQCSLFDEIEREQKNVDLKNEQQKYSDWLWENSHYNYEDMSHSPFDKIPNFLDIEIDYQYGLGGYQMDGLLPMSLKFDKKYQTTNGEVKEWVMESLIQRITNGDMTEHPFHSIELDYDIKKDKHLSLMIKSKPLKTIQMLFDKYSEGDNEFLKQFYIDNFLGDSELVENVLEEV